MITIAASAANTPKTIHGQTKPFFRSIPKQSEQKNWRWYIREWLAQAPLPHLAHEMSVFFPHLTHFTRTMKQYHEAKEISVIRLVNFRFGIHYMPLVLE
jgi:hypothetical protein